MMWIFEITPIPFQSLTPKMSTTSLLKLFLKGWRYSLKIFTFLSNSWFALFSCPTSAARAPLSCFNCCISFSTIWQCCTMPDSASLVKLTIEELVENVDDFDDLGDGDTDGEDWLILRRGGGWWVNCCWWSLESDVVLPSTSMSTLSVWVTDSGCKNDCVMWCVMGHGELSLSNSFTKPLFNWTVKLILKQNVDQC